MGFGLLRVKTVIDPGVTARPFAPPPPGPPPLPRDPPPRDGRSSPGCRPARAARTRRSRAVSPSRSRAAGKAATSASRRSPAEADHAPLPTAAAQLELGLHERQAVEARGGAANHRAEHLGQRDEGQVDREQVRRERRVGGLQGAGVLSLQHAHPLVLAEPPMELSVGHVERDHGGGAALEEESLKPPVEAPTSRQWRPEGSIAKASSALASLMPPRDTKGGPRHGDVHVLPTIWPGFSARCCRYQAARRPRGRPPPPGARLVQPARPAGCRDAASAPRQRTREAL